MKTWMPPTAISPEGVGGDQVFHCNIVLGVVAILDGLANRSHARLEYIKLKLAVGFANLRIHIQCLGFAEFVFLDEIRHLHLKGFYLLRAFARLNDGR